MWISKAQYDRELLFLRDRVNALELKLESEAERNRTREDALIDRLLAKNQVFPIKEEIEPVRPEPLQDNPALDEFKSHFDEWAREANVSPYEARKQWELNKDAYIQDLG